MKKAALLALLCAGCMHVIVRAQLASGRNSNVNPGVVDQYVGDRFLQRQVEPKIAVSSINQQHMLVLSNDYRTVDFAADTGVAEGFVFNQGLPPDAWIGIYRSYNGGENFVNGLWPGFPGDTSPVGMSQPNVGKNAGSDAAVAVDHLGHFYVVAMFFNRGADSMIVASRLTDYNDESPHPIRWDNIPRVIVQGSNTARFADLPSIATDHYRSGPARTCEGQATTDVTRAAGKVYIAYTLFNGQGQGQIWFKSSSNCGMSYPVTRQLNTPAFPHNQRVVLAVDPRPTAQGGGTLYAVWRSFLPSDQIVMTRSVDGGLNWSPPFAITPRSGPPALCKYDAPTVPTGGNNLNKSAEVARALAFPSVEVDFTGKIHVVWTERTNTSGIPQSVGCNPPGTTLLPRIVWTSSANGGATWTPRRAIDIGSRCEASITGATPHPDGPAEVACTQPGRVLRGAGPQMQPVMSSNGGHLMVMYSEGRCGPGCPDGLTNGFYSGRDKRLELRAARIDPANGALLGTKQVTQYPISFMTGNIARREGLAQGNNGPEALATNLSFLPQYVAGTTAFMGDHNGLAPAETFVLEPPLRWATLGDVPAARSFGVWGGDNRLAQMPFNPSAVPPQRDIDGQWPLYDKPGQGVPSTCNAGIKNSNNYVSFIGSRVEAFAHQSFKPAGAGEIQRTWAVTIRNRSNVTRRFRLELQEKGPFGASWNQDPTQPPVKVLGNTLNNPDCINVPYPACTAVRTILPFSSMTLTVFGQVTNAAVAAPIKVLVNDLGTAQNPDAVIRLNPNPNNPAPLAGNEIGNKETHGPSVGDIKVTNHNAAPGASNPGASNPGASNPGASNPGASNPGASNAGFTDYTDVQTTVRASDANTTSAFHTFVNIADPDHLDESHLVQLILSRTHANPTADLTQNGCSVKEILEDEIISNIPVPGASNLGCNPGASNPGASNAGCPGASNPGASNPGASNPGASNPGASNATFALTPSDAPAGMSSATMALAGGFDAMSIGGGPDGTTVGDPKPDEVLVTVRVWHCRVSGLCGGKDAETGEAFRPTTTLSADGAISFIVSGEARNNIGGMLAPAPETATTGNDLVISSPESLIATPSTVVPGDNVELSAFRVRNDGNDTSSGFTNGFYLSTDDIIDNTDTLLGANSNAPLEGGEESGPYTPSVRIPEGTAPGTYYLGILVDNSNRNGEIDESNNSMSVPITVVPGLAIPRTDFRSFGVGDMRDTGSGTILVSGVSGPVRRALLYWHGPSNSATPANQTVFFDENSVTGTAIGTADDNNWFDETCSGGCVYSHAYRADVTSFVTGNGSYGLTGFRKPSEGPITENINGVSLIVFYTDDSSGNDRTVYILDGNDSNYETGTLTASNWDQTMSGVYYQTDSGPARLELHVADGQVFGANDDGAVKVNEVTIAPSPPAETGDIFEGDSVQGSEGDALWDIKPFTITSILTDGTNSLHLTSDAVFDALSLVVMVVSVPSTTAAPACAATPFPVSWWPGEGNASDVQDDNGGSDNETGVTYTPGKVGRAFTFDGVNDYIEIDDSENLRPTELTVDFWFKSAVPLNAASVDVVPLVVKLSTFEDANTESNGYDFFYESGLIRFGLRRSDGTRIRAQYAVSIPAGQWHHVAGTFDGTLQKLYFDGVLVATVDWEASGFGTPTYGDEGETPIIIGRASSSAFGGGDPVTYRFSGQIDEVDLFDQALTLLQIQAIFNAGSSGKCPFSP